MSDLRDISEAEVMQEVKEVIKLTGIKLQRINVGCFKVGNNFIRTADNGTLDYEGYDKHGRFVAIECKRPVGGRLSPAQACRIEDINVKGGIAFVAHSGAEAFEKLKQNKCI